MQANGDIGQNEAFGAGEMASHRSQYRDIHNVTAWRSEEPQRLRNEAPPPALSARTVSTPEDEMEKPRAVRPGAMNRQVPAR